MGMIREFFRSIWTNFGTILLAFFLALSVWVSAVIAEDPNITQVVPGGVELVYDEYPTEELIVVGDIPNTVKVELIAPNSIWELINSKEIELFARIDLENLSEGDHQVPITIDIPSNFPIQIINVNPIEVSVHLEHVLFRTFEVDPVYVGEPALGYQIVNLALSENEIEVLGPESLVSQVDEMRIIIDVSGARESIVRELNVIAVNQNGQIIQGLEFSPSRVSITQGITQSGGYREVAVVVETQGNLANGYRITNISVFPRTVTLFSNDPDMISDMPGYISTIPLDLTDARDDIEARVLLDLPDGVVLVGDEQSVEIQVGIAAIETGVTITVPVEVIGLEPGLKAEVSPEFVNVFIFGAFSVLDELSSEDVRVFVNLANLGVGTHLLTPEEEILPEGITVDAIAPDTIQVVISESD